MTRPSNARGFTLIELMITVAIVAILAAIALPAYKDSVIKGKRAQGRSALLELAQAQERYFTANNTYTLLSLGDTSVANMKTYSGDNASSPAYKLKATAECPNTTNLRECVRLTAVPQFTDTQGGNLTLDTNGFKSCNGGTNTAVCWP